MSDISRKYAAQVNPTFKPEPEEKEELWLISFTTNVTGLPLSKRFARSQKRAKAWSNKIEKKYPGTKTVIEKIRLV